MFFITGFFLVCGFGGVEPKSRLFFVTPSSRVYALKNTSPGDGASLFLIFFHFFSPAGEMVKCVETGGEGLGGEIFEPTGGEGLAGERGGDGAADDGLAEEIECN